jgi:hypothetical protein
MRWSGSLCGRKGRRERRGQRRRQRRQRRRRWRRRPRRRRRQQRHRWGIRLRARGDAQQGERHEEKDDARESRRGSEAAHRAAPRRGSARHTSGAHSTSAHGRRLHTIWRDCARKDASFSKMRREQLSEFSKRNAEPSRFQKCALAAREIGGTEATTLEPLPAALGDTAGLQPLRQSFQSVFEVECDQRGGQRQPNVGGGSTDRGILVPFYLKWYRTARPSSKDLFKDLHSHM